MRHNVKTRELGRYGSERRALLKSLAISLITRGKVRTTTAKAKVLRPFVEQLVTRARKDTLANRRVVAARLGDRRATSKLFTDYGAKYETDKRAGGYLRIIKVSGFRRGDASEVAEVQWV